MGSASVVHYGIDQSCRIPLLRYTGFEVAECESLLRLRQLLRAGDFDGILVAESPSTALIRTSRQLSAAPLIYFASDATAIHDRDFDLIIEPFTPPDEWIRSVQNLLERSGRIRSQSGRLREASVQLRAESAAIRAATRASLQRSRDRRNPKL